jgi:hypothetical protein
MPDDVKPCRYLNLAGRKRSVCEDSRELGEIGDRKEARDRVRGSEESVCKAARDAILREEKKRGEQLCRGPNRPADGQEGSHFVYGARAVHKREGGADDKEEREPTRGGEP